MVFSSIEFLWFFMPAVLVLYALAPPRARNALLAAASVVFYAWGAHAFVYVFLASVGLNYCAGLIIERLRRQGGKRAARAVMWVAIAVDLAFLFVWKYTVFAATQLDRLLGGFGHPQAIGIPSITLPIGISFFTFHAISYVVDTARGVSPPMRRLPDFAQYMAFFPQLIAGPIVRYHQIDEQIRHPPPRSQRVWDFADGFPRFAWGLSKKVLVADQVGRIADAVFANTHALSTGGAWLGTLAYTVQIYFDFSGYSDMALGLARMFGFRFPENFNRPYSSLSITDFWRRWHMTLSGWFRDYVYVPLGGNRGTAACTARNLLFVFLLTGAWHGAAWTFVLWGLYHGTIIVLERVTGYSRMSEDRLVAPRRALALLMVMVGWVLFRAPTLGDAGRIYAAMVPLHFHGLSAAVHAAVTRQTISALVVGGLTVLLPRGLVVGRVVSDQGWSAKPLLTRAAVLLPLPLAAIYVAAGSFSPFLYFRF